MWCTGRDSWRTVPAGQPTIPLVLLTQFGAPSTRPHNSIPQPNNLYSLCVGVGWVQLHTKAHTVCNQERKGDDLLSSVSGRIQCIPAHKNTIPKCYAIIHILLCRWTTQSHKCYSFSSPPAHLVLEHFAMPATPLFG